MESFWQPSLTTSHRKETIEFDQSPFWKGNQPISILISITMRQGVVRVSEVSGRFLKKAAQKLLLCWAMGCVGDNARDPA
jgi:hypothetical protein